MTNAQIIRQVFHNPQVSLPPISYKITDKLTGSTDYTSEYVDIDDLKHYLAKLERQLKERLKEEK